MDLDNLLEEENEFDSDSSSSSSEESDDDDDEYLLLLIIISCACNGPSRRLIPRIKGYVEDVITKYNAEEFRQTFRYYLLLNNALSL